MKTKINLTTKELYNHFITSDYKGTADQELCFREFMRREWWKFWKWVKPTDRYFKRK